MLIINGFLFRKISDEQHRCFKNRFSRLLCIGRDDFFVFFYKDILKICSGSKISLRGLIFDFFKFISSPC